MSISQAFFKNFLGNSPLWYKVAILFFLVINPIVFFIDPFVAGWMLVVEFIFTLAMALKCYPLQPGGLLAIEAVIIGMTSTHHIKEEILANFEVILLLMFMVAGIYFMKNLLLFLFTKLLIGVRNKKVLSLSFCAAAAFLSAFLDALTVIAVIISVSVGFYGVYHKVASGFSFHDDSDINCDENILKDREILDEFRAFLRSLLMHAGVGSALGGVMTMVGEPQNLIIAETVQWHFAEFLIRVAPVSVPVLVAGLLTCYLVERFKLFGYGAELPEPVWETLAEYAQVQEDQRTPQDRAKLYLQAVVAVWLIIGLALHLASVGLIGLTIIIFCTAFCGVIDEHHIGESFKESLPFTALLVVFFSVVAVIVDLQLFQPLIEYVLQADPKSQLGLFYIFNGLLSSISDNVFVGTVYINEATKALHLGSITREQYDLIAVAINTGTNLPSVATPNGQAAFLFLLTSSIAPLVRLSYGKMVWMALPYTIVMSLVGYFSLVTFLPSFTEFFMNLGLIGATLVH